MKLKLLDLYCSAGGCSVGYNRAGFDVVGVDNKKQPNYPFKLIIADAKEFCLSGFDVIHASPPCQKYTKIHSTYKKYYYPDDVETIRDRLIKTGKPYILENVVGAPMKNYITLCGTMFGLRVIRHRLFECNPFIIPNLPGCNHFGKTLCAYKKYHRLKDLDLITCTGNNFNRKDGMLAMGIDWNMTRKEVSQAIPPAYTEFIGINMIKLLNK